MNTELTGQEKAMIAINGLRESMIKHGIPAFRNAMLSMNQFSNELRKAQLKLKPNNICLGIEKHGVKTTQTK